MRYRIAVASRCFAQPLKQSIQTAAAIGAEAIQIDARHELKPSELSETGVRQFLHLLQEQGLSVASLSFPTRRSFYDLDALDARLAAVKSAMDFAFRLKAKVITARIGKVPADNQSAAYGILVEALNELARYGNRVGVTFSVTPSGDTAESLVQLIDQVREGALGIDFDPASFVMTEQQPVDALRRLHNHVFHVRVRDAIRDIDGAGLEVPIGRGQVAWDEMLATIDEIEYRGWLTIERTQGDDKLNDITRAVKFLKQLAME